MTELFTAIFVRGADAKTFLQGQLTCDMTRLAADTPQLACVNSSQGRVQAVLTVIERAEEIALLVVTSLAEQTIQRLRKYILRSKVTVERAEDWPHPLRNATLIAQLRAGIPHVFPETYEAFVAQMLNLDVLGAISFDKGCYTGQEIIARTHYRGTIKRRMVRLAAACSPPAPGARVLNGEEHAGDVVYAAKTDQGCELLAVISLAHKDVVLSIDNSPLTRLPLPYEV